MNKIFGMLILALISSLCLADDTSANLTIRIGGLLNDRGQGVAYLFREGDDVMKIQNSYLHTQVKINDKKAQLFFRNIKYGKYAVTAFHDENGNGKLDHNFLHMPAEPLGFSNNFKLGIFSGLPNFEKLQFVFGPGTDVIDITIY